MKDASACSYWIGYQKEIYQVAIDHGDGDKPVYYSELGWTDNGVSTTKADNCKFLIDALKVIDDENISIYMVNPKAPCFIKNDNESYIYLVLPVNFTTVN